MRFVSTLFWVLIAVIVALFARGNWTPVTLNLWGDIQAETKLPVLATIAFLLGFVPTWLVMGARLWSLRRRLEAMERSNLSPTEHACADEAEPAQ